MVLFCNFHLNLKKSQTFLKHLPLKQDTNTKLELRFTKDFQNTKSQSNSYFTSLRKGNTLAKVTSGKLRSYAACLYHKGAKASVSLNSTKKKIAPDICLPGFKRSWKLYYWVDIKHDKVSRKEISVARSYYWQRWVLEVMTDKTMRTTITAPGKKAVYVPDPPAFSAFLALI